MIELLFIIDFFEQFLFKRPEGNENQYFKLMLNLKKQALNNCKQPNNRFKETINFQNNIYKFLAISNDENIIIGILIKGDIHQERNIWSLIEKTFDSKLLKEYKNKEDDQNFNLNDSMKKEIGLLIENYEKKIESNDFHNLLKESLSVTDRLTDKAFSTGEDLNKILIETENVKDHAKEFKDGAKDLEISVYWYQKKTFIFLIGIMLLFIVFSVIFVAKFMF